MSSETVPRQIHRFNSAQKEIISGLSAGLLVTITTHPLDVLKVRLQLDTTSKNQHESYQKIFQSMRQLATVNGRLQPSYLIKDMYRGISPNIIGNTLAWSIYFSLYRFYKDLTFKLVMDSDPLTNKTVDSQLKSHHYLISAYAAGFTSCLITNPIWVLKTRTLSTPKTYPGAYQSIADGFKRILREEGVVTLWRGLLPSLFGVLQGSIQFSIYDTFKQTFHQDTDLTLWQSIYLSATSKVISNVTLYPFQVVRSRLQNYGNTQTMRYVLVNTYKTDGFVGFYKGLVPNILRVLPLTCITFSCYEQVRNLL